MPKPRTATATDGKLSAAGALGRTIMHPDVTGVIDDYKRLSTEEARTAFADHFLARTAGVMDEIWPTFYELLKRVEDGELYRKPGHLAIDQKFGSFKEYFEQRVGRPFETWAQMEHTYHYAQKYAPELFAERYEKAQSYAAMSQEDKTYQEVGSLDNVKTPYSSAGNYGGNSTRQALRKLRKDAPELHSEVLAGHLSAHGAMIKAGFRPKTISIPVGNPERLAAYLREHMPDSIPRLIELLTSEEE